MGATLSKQLLWLHMNKLKLHVEIISWITGISRLCMGLTWSNLKPICIICTVYEQPAIDGQSVAAVRNKKVFFEVQSFCLQHTYNSDWTVFYCHNTFSSLHAVADLGFWKGGVSCVHLWSLYLVKCNKVCKVLQLGESGSRRIFDFRLSEIVSGAVLGWNSKSWTTASKRRKKFPFQLTV